MQTRHNKNIYLVAPSRTPIGKFGGALSVFTAPELGAFAAKETIQRSGIDPAELDEAIFGNARQAGVRPNPARQVAFNAGCPETVPAYTVNKACASGMKAIINAYQAIALGDADLILAGGTESMSNTPYLIPRARWGVKFGHDELVDGMYRDGFLCPLCGELMGKTAENLADKYGVTRQESDEFALRSQQKAATAQKQARFLDEVVPIEIKDRKGQTTVMSSDEHPRSQTTLEGLAKLKPVFKENGTVHAGNASGITDGAAAVLVVSEQRLRDLNLEPIVKIVDYTVAGVDPSIMGIGPVPAVRSLLKRNHFSLNDIDLIELNEAFAVQVLACQRELNFKQSVVNVNGGSIALGHPIGCTGARIIVTLTHEMKKRDATLGLATLCVSGGMGMTVLLERA
ncbi:MAG: thiolase family protein [bacterium]